MALGDLVGDGLLSFDRFGVARGGGIFGEDVFVGLEGVEEVSFAFEDFGKVVGGFGGVGRLGEIFGDLAVGGFGFGSVA